MKYIIEKKNALKIFYYFMAIDGEIASDEKIKFEEIALEVDGIEYSSYKDDLLNECDKNIASIISEDEAYDVIQEEVDKIIHSQDDNCIDGLSRRLLIWNLYTLSFSDGHLAVEEKRFISHLGRILDVDKSVLLEMEQLMQTAIAVMNELDVLSTSTRPYAEIKPLVEEVERRKNVLVKAAQNLISDDYFEVNVNKEKNKRFSDMGKKFTEAVSPMISNAGEKTQKTLKEAKDVIGEKTSKGVLGFKERAEKITKKFGKS